MTSSIKPGHAAASDAKFESYSDFYQNSAYAQFDQEHRKGGSFGVSLMQVSQTPFDLIDAPVPEFVFLWERNGGGRTAIDIGDGKSIVEKNPKNTLCITPANTAVHCDVGYDTDIVVAAIPQTSILSLLSEHRMNLDVFGAFYGKMKEAPQAINALQHLWFCSISRSPSASLFFDAAMLQFLAIVANSSHLSPLAMAKPEDQRIARTIDYIYAHLNTPLTIAELANIAALSPSQFSRIFKATTGKPVWQYVQLLRVERAKSDLLHTSMPISQIAYKCGFANQNHMTNLFKRYVGSTPGELRRK